MSEFQSQEQMKVAVEGVLKGSLEVNKFRAPVGALIHSIAALLNGTDIEGKPISGEVPRDLTDFYGLLTMRSKGKNKEDKAWFQKNYVVVGDPIVGDPAGSGEVIVTPYTNPVARRLVRSINPRSRLVGNSLELAEDPDEAVAQYEAIKKGTVVVLSKSVAEGLRNDIYSHLAKRQEVYEMLSRGEDGLIKDNLGFVAEARGMKPEDVTLKNAMGLYPVVIKGLRPLWVWSVGNNNNSNVNSNNDLHNDNARPVGIGKLMLGHFFYFYIIHISFQIDIAS